LILRKGARTGRRHAGGDRRNARARHEQFIPRRDRPRRARPPGLADNITVEAKGCVVTLTGRVADPALRRRLSGVVLGLPQVYGVCNQLDVSPP